MTNETPGVDAAVVVADGLSARAALAHAAPAAGKLAYLMLEAARRRLSGVALKDDGRTLGA